MRCIRRHRIRYMLVGTAIACAAAIAIPTGGPLAKTRIHGGFVSGERFLDWPILRQRAYVTGLIEGMLLAPEMGGNAKRLTWLVACADAIGRKGIRRSINRYLNARDATLRNRNPAKMYRAVRAGCLKKGTRRRSDPRTDGGYLTNKAYLDLNGLQKRAYVAGLVEGLILAPAFGGSQDRLDVFLACVDRLGWNGVRRAINAELLASSKSWPLHDPKSRSRAILRYCARQDRAKEQKKS